MFQLEALITFLFICEPHSLFYGLGDNGEPSVGTSMFLNMAHSFFVD